MQQSCTYGSVRGAAGDRRPYRDETCAMLPHGWLRLLIAAPRNAVERRRRETVVHRASGAPPRDASVQGEECLPR